MLRPYNCRLTLLPGQALETPARLGAAVMFFVQLAFEAVFHIVDSAETGFFQCLARVARAVAAAADQDDGPVDGRGPFDMVDEFRIAFPSGTVHPRDQQRALGMSHEQIFPFAAHVDENGVRVVAQKLDGFFRLQVLHLAQYRPVGASPFLQANENGVTHGSYESIR